jgi:hypothetical protein
MNEMTILYARKTAAHKYALGFVCNGRLYVVILSFAELSRFFKLDRASSKRGGFAKIRIKLSSKDRAELSQKAELIGAESLLTKDAKHNKGENFERELTERWTDETWTKDSVPFWVAGDIRVNGEEIQVKLDGAELTNERMLARLA